MLKQGDFTGKISSKILDAIGITYARTERNNGTFARNLIKFYMKVSTCFLFMNFRIKKHLIHLNF